MPSGGHTTVIQRILERRAERPATSQEGTTATVAVMLRVVPPPKALLVCADANVRRLIEERVTADLLDMETVTDEHEALRKLSAEFRPVVVTDSLEVVRKLRAGLMPPSGARRPDRPAMETFAKSLEGELDRFAAAGGNQRTVAHDDIPANDRGDCPARGLHAVEWRPATL